MQLLVLSLRTDTLFLGQYTWLLSVLYSTKAQSKYKMFVIRYNVNFYQDLSGDYKFFGYPPSVCGETTYISFQATRIMQVIRKVGLDYKLFVLPYKYPPIFVYQLVFILYYDAISNSWLVFMFKQVRKDCLVKI